VNKTEIIRQQVEQFSAAIAKQSKEAADSMEKFLVDISPLVESQEDAEGLHYCYDAVVVRAGRILEGWTHEQKMAISSIVITALRVFLLAAK
jgi:hypothetical protein